MKKLLVFAAAAIMLFACSKEDEVADRPFAGKADGPVFYASVEGGTAPGTGTKVYADENLLVLWNADDRISIFNKTTYNYEYTFTGEDGDNYGVFEQEPVSGFISGNSISNIYAVYPYSTSNKVNNTGTQITVNLPSEQIYKANSFGIGANTMVAVTDDQFLSFKNVCGYLKFRFWGNNVTVKSITLKGNNGEKIAGKAIVTPSASSAPTVAMDGTATDSIKMTCAQPVTLGSSSDASTEFIFVIPPTTFSNGFTVTVTDVNGQVFEKSSDQSLTITRNRLESMGAIEVDLNSDVFVEFEDDNFKAYCVENFDTNGDGEISLTEASVVTRIEVITDENHMNISSLAGIEGFVNLEHLVCKGNHPTYEKGKLNSLDLCKNTSLVYLDCEVNNIEELDLSNNTLLQELHCNYNQLTRLNVSKCSSLIKLYCGWNNLTSLIPFEGVNNSLKELYCVYNQLETLETSNCVALNKIWCEYNNLASIDVSANSLLEVLDCQDNDLSSLNLSNNPSLTELYCFYNQITTLDVSHNTALETLWCYSNQISSLNLASNTALVNLNCANNHLTSLNLSGNPFLRELCCSANELTNLVFSNNTALTSVDCNTNQLTSLDVSNCTALTYLECSRNKLNTLNVNNATALHTIYCYDNQLTSLVVSNLTGLVVLNFGNNQITSIDVSNNAALETLWCYLNQISSLDVTHNTAITNIKCDFNQLTSLNLSKNTNLTELSAWPQSGTLAAVVIKQGLNITYYSPDHSTIVDPADYGTTIIEVD